jgi:hypothetical protein
MKLPRSTTTDRNGRALRGSSPPPLTWKAQTMDEHELEAYLDLIEELAAENPELLGVDVADWADLDTEVEAPF